MKIGAELLSLNVLYLMAAAYQLRVFTSMQIAFAIDYTRNVHYPLFPFGKGRGAKDVVGSEIFCPLDIGKQVCYLTHYPVICGQPPLSES